MSWTYLELHEDGALLPQSPQLPGPNTAYLGFDIHRMTVVIGYTERGGYHSFLDPNVNDDCNIVAFAPLSETSRHADVRLDLAETPYTLLGFPAAENGEAK